MCDNNIIMCACTYTCNPTHGMLVKRPMVITHDIVLVGFKEADWEGTLL